MEGKEGEGIGVWGSKDLMDRYRSDPPTFSGFGGLARLDKSIFFGCSSCFCNRTEAVIQWKDAKEGGELVISGCRL